MIVHSRQMLWSECGMLRILECAASQMPGQQICLLNERFTNELGHAQGTDNKQQ